MLAGASGASDGSPCSSVGVLKGDMHLAAAKQLIMSTDVRESTVFVKPAFQEIYVLSAQRSRSRVFPFVFDPAIFY